MKEGERRMREEAFESVVAAVLAAMDRAMAGFDDETRRKVFTEVMLRAEEYLRETSVR